jgi:hypothetical protein
MGMMLYDALVLTRVVRQLSNRRGVLTLGVPTLNFSYKDYKKQLDKAPGTVEEHGHMVGEFHDHKEFFKNIGIETVSSLDISAYEGADIVGDLNDPKLAQKIGGRYDLIYDSGTIEHIFDISTALRTINDLIEIDGAIVHTSPANGFMDHGFWQISPDLLNSFYRSAGFEILTMSLLVLGDWIHAVPVNENYYRTKGRGFIAKELGEALLIFAARKTRDVPNVQLQLQDYYAQMHKGEERTDRTGFFIPFDAGKPRPAWQEIPIRVVVGTLIKSRNAARKILGIWR